MTSQSGCDKTQNAGTWNSGIQNSKSGTLKHGTTSLVRGLSWSEFQYFPMQIKLNTSFYSSRRIFKYIIYFFLILFIHHLNCYQLHIYIHYLYFYILYISYIINIFHALYFASINCIFFVSCKNLPCAMLISHIMQLLFFISNSRKTSFFCLYHHSCEISTY